MLNDIGKKQAIGVDVSSRNLVLFYPARGAMVADFSVVGAKQDYAVFCDWPHCRSFAGKSREHRSTLVDVRQMGYRDDLCQDWRAEPPHRRAGPMRVGPGRGGGRKAFHPVQHRPRIDRLPSVLHANARLHSAHHGLHDAGSPGAADFDRRVGFQPGMLGLCLWAVAGRRPDPQRHRPAGAVDHRRNLLEIYRSQRPIAANHFRRRRGRHFGRGLGRTFAGPIRLRHRRARGQYVDGHRRRGTAQRTPPSSRASASAGPAACSWTGRSWSSSPSTWCRR